MILVILFILVSLFANLITPSSDMFWATELTWEKDPFGSLSHKPDSRNWLGTISARDIHQQIDVYTGLIIGFKTAMIFGVSAAIITALIGTLVGALAAMKGGWVDVVLMRLTDALLTLPLIVGIMLIEQIITYMVGGTSTFRLFYNYSASPAHIPDNLLWIVDFIDPIWMAIVLFAWMPYTRMTNTLVLKGKGEVYVEASRALGANQSKLFFKHILPNSISPLLVFVTKDIGGFVLLQATFTFIGVGSSSEWGTMLGYARDWIIGPGGTIFGRWWVYIPTTLVLILFGSSWNLLGDGLSNWFNPRKGKSLE